MSVNSYEKLYGRMQPVTPESAETIDNLAQVRPHQIPAPTTRERVDALEYAGVYTREQADTLRAEFAERQRLHQMRQVQVGAQITAAEIEAAARVMGQQTSRPSWDEFFFSMAELASTMATCPRAHCGAAIVRHKRILSLGFNGAPPGEPHCPSEGEALAEHLTLAHCEVSVHAEANALKNAVGNVYGATIYVYGHRAVCGNCKGQMALVGITDIRHRPGPHHGVTR